MLCEELEFTWKITNFSMYPNLPGSAIQCPLFTVGNPYHSIFHLKLYSSGFDESSSHVVAADLIRLNGSFKGPLLFQISLVACGDDSTIIISNDESTDPVNCIRIFGEMDVFRVVLSSKDLLEKFLSDDTLIMRCKLVIQNVSPRFSNHLITLSQTLNSLYESKAHSDLTLCTKDHEFQVHKFLLSYRAPNFFEDLGLHSNNLKHGCIQIDGISTPALQSLIQYLYNGKLEDLPPDNIPEILEIAERFGVDMHYFVELTCKVVSLEQSSTLSMGINVVSKEIYWDIHDETKMEDDPDNLVQTICFGPIQFLVRLHFNVISAYISFKCLSKLEGGLYMGCKLYTGNKEAPNWGSIKYKKLQFSANEKETEHYLPSQHLQRYSKESGLRLQVLISVTDCETTTSVEHSTSGPPEHSSQFGLCSLFNDLVRLFNETQLEKTGDVTFGIGNLSIWAHKAILAAWSPVFNAMFNCDMAGKKDDTKIILDADNDTTLRLIRFLYSGLPFKQSLEEDVKFYVLSDEYQISSLFKGCSSFLESHLALSNVCDILKLAYAHGDDLLLASAKKYFCSNQEAIMRSKEWELLCDSYPHFSSMMEEPI